MTSNRYALEVNETRFHPAARAGDWWSTFRARSKRRITVVTPSIGGDLVRVACDDQEDAVWLRDHMVDAGGIPVTAMQIVRVS
jgi:hypothetical protein